MKRSEMIKNMVDVLFYGSLAAHVNDSNVMITMLAEKDAKDILDLMEKLGMRPLVSGSLQSQISDIHNEWEEETED